MKKQIYCSAIALAWLIGTGLSAQEFRATDNGLTLTPAVGDAKQVTLRVMSDDIIEVVATPIIGQKLKPSLMTIAEPQQTKFTITSNANSVFLKTSNVSAILNRSTGQVEFKNRLGQTLLKEEGASQIKPVTIEGPTKTPDDKYFMVQQQFNKNSKEAFFGLGQRQDGTINYAGQDALLAQHNMNIAIPFIVSSNNYGVLWDNNSITRWGDPTPYAQLSRDFSLRGLDGTAGVLTAKYYVDGVHQLTRNESKIDYQYIPDLKANWPKDLFKKKGQKIVWEGMITPNSSGSHKFQLYSSGYAKLSIDDKVVKDVWRQNWNPWYHNFDVNMTKGKAVKFKLEWIPEDGYITVLHNNPMPQADRNSMFWTSEVGEAKRYYFINGKDIDGVISGYRQLTGKSNMMPKWAYGFWQSRQRYKTQDEITQTIAEYRKRKIPLDNIVLDWFYWPENAWGSHDFDLERFPDAKKMVDDVHKQNAQIMISVWGKFYPTTENFKELDAKGYVYRRNIESGDLDWVGPGYLNTHYDPYSKEARDIYWRQINEKLKSKGFDAWWADNTEPDIHSNIPIEELKLRIGPTTFGPGAAVFNPYSLMTTQAFYEGEIASGENKRPFILSRSGFAGLQRHSTAIWSGDVVSRWNNLHDQIAAGVGAGYSGLPNWTHDIGGFANETRYTGETMKPEDLKEWQELNLRWFQFGVFSPIFRSHGEFPLREIYNLAPDNSEVQNNLIWFNKLRYRLMPYIYSTAATTYYEDSTIMRGLNMDFGSDARVQSINDQYMFGKQILVAPIHEYKARSRKVYLPKGTIWYNLNTGASFNGGQELRVNAPLTQMPLFARAGAIIPTTQVMQYVDEVKNAPLNLIVFPGANGEFTLYDDDGRSLDYEKGKFAKIKISFDNRTRTLNIGAREGSYDGMPFEREIRVKLFDNNAILSKDFEAFDKKVIYKGQAVRIRL